MKERTMVVLDLDDTLLTSEKTIPEATVNYLKHLQNDDDVFLTFDTGRPYRAVKAYYDKLNLSGRIICNSGSLIIAPHENNRIYFEVHHEASSINRIIDNMGIGSFLNIMVEDGHDLYLAYNNDVMKDFCYTEGMNVICGPRFHEIKSPSGAVFVLKDEKDRDRLMSLGNLPSSQTGLRFWENSNVAELYFKGVNKASAMYQLAREEGIHRSDIIAFGDGESDIEMLYRSGFGVAMKNADDKVKRGADMVSLDDNNHEGVRKTLELLLPESYLK